MTAMEGTGAAERGPVPAADLQQQARELWVLTVVLINGVRDSHLPQNMRF